jgi:2C-methyl-D-erythritol 2,4-cyclodiphosphate synthase
MQGEDYIVRKMECMVVKVKKKVKPSLTHQLTHSVTDQLTPHCHAYNISARTAQKTPLLFTGRYLITAIV